MAGNQQHICDGPDDSRRRRVITGAGISALAFYGAHAGYHGLFGHPANALWVCHVATAVVGVALLCRSPTWVTVGVLWLVGGLPLWIYDLIRGGEFIPTSPLTHVGGLVTGLIGLRCLGAAKHAWWEGFRGNGRIVRVLPQRNGGRSSPTSGRK